MNRFWELLEQSVIVQALLTAMFGGAIIYLYVVGKPVPSELINAFWALIGLWTGGKIENARRAAFVAVAHKRK